MNKLMQFMGGVTLGALVGASIAILLAPMSGNEIRDQMRSEFERVQAEVKKAAVDRRAELEDQLAALRAPRPGGQA